MSDQTDLKFLPIENNAPRILSRNDIAHYNTMGYVSPLDLLSDNEAEEKRKYFDGLLAQIPDSGA